MWVLTKLFYRTWQGVMRLLSRTLRFREPELLSGAGSLVRLPEAVKGRGITRVLIVTDKVLMKLGMLAGLLESMNACGIAFVIYDQVQPNPTIDNVEKACDLYLENKCQGIIAFGGGSPIDCAKAAAARASNRSRTIRHMKGALRIAKPLPPLFAVPTTAGTGSETTLAAVITDPGTYEKFAIMDPKLIPLSAVLDPELTLGLPPHITATTGMDALTHAVEAYIGRNGTIYTDKNAEEAVRIIFENLEMSYRDGSNLEARSSMLLASYKAGCAFTRAYVGYVHAIAHTLGGLYGIPHGLANAVVLPYVLEAYGSCIYPKLARLARIAGTGSEDETEAQLAEGFIQSIREMNSAMNIPLGFSEIADKDVHLIVKRVLLEGNPGYPVPRIIDEKECTDIIRRLIDNQ